MNKKRAVIIILALISLVISIYTILPFSPNILTRYTHWIDGVKMLFSSFYQGFSGRISYLLVNWQYPLFILCIISWSIVLIKEIFTRNKKENPEIEQKKESFFSKIKEKITKRNNLVEKEIKQKNILDELIINFKKNLDETKIEEAKKIYNQIRELAEKEKYSKEQYDKIIELYKRLS